MKALVPLYVTLMTAGIASASVQAQETLNIYNWSDYIAEDTVANFQQKTGIKVVYDVFGSNEVLEAKRLTGHSGYDITVPSDNFMAKQIAAGIYMPLDKSKLSNLSHMNPKLMAELAEVVDPGNQYGVPYM